MPGILAKAIGMDFDALMGAYGTFLGSDTHAVAHGAAERAFGA